MKGGNVTVVTMPQYGVTTRDSPETDPGGRCWWRGDREICGFLNAGTEVDGVPSRGMPSYGEQPRKTQIKLHVLALEENVFIIQEVLEPISRCIHCGMHMTAARPVKHRRISRCKKTMKMWLRRRYMEMGGRCEDIEFRL